MLLFNKKIVRQSALDDAAELLGRAALAHGVPGADVLELGHQLGELLGEHFGQPTDRFVFAPLKDGGHRRPSRSFERS